MHFTDVSDEDTEDTVARLEHFAEKYLGSSEIEVEKQDADPNQQADA